MEDELIIKIVLAFVSILTAAIWTIKRILIALINMDKENELTAERGDEKLRVKGRLNKHGAKVIDDFLNKPVIKATSSKKPLKAKKD